MDQSITILDQIKKEFPNKEVDVRTYSPLTLAFMGDCVYDLIIRTMVVETGNRATSDLHKRTSHYVKASAQAFMIEALQDKLTNEEQAVYRRGRNAKSYTTAKNASVLDYRKATGFEALIGYLYLSNRIERVLELVRLGVDMFEGTEKQNQDK